MDRTCACSPVTSSRAPPPFVLPPSLRGPRARALLSTRHAAPFVLPPSLRGPRALFGQPFSRAAPSRPRGRPCRVRLRVCGREADIHSRAGSPRWTGPPAPLQPSPR
eukprot:6596383-Prymnesium_polylepis.1